jgi:predicted HNH restriction endonuclease
MEYIKIPIGQNDLITLCPNCHRIAHLLVNKDATFINKASLLPEIAKINMYIIKK